MSDMTTANHQQQRAHPDLVHDPLGKLFAQLAIPAAIGFLFATLYNLVDSYWANQLGRTMGSADPADALGAGAGYFFLMMSVAIGLNQGATAMITNALGRGDKPAARRTFFQTVGLGILSAGLLAVLGWLVMPMVLKAQFADRPEMVALALNYLIPVYICAFSFIFGLVMNAALSAQGDFLTLGVVQIAAFVLNCVFDPLFMFGYGPIPGFGIAGLAVATVSINIIGMAIIAWRTAKSPLFADPLWSPAVLSLRGIGDLFRQCVPAALNMFVIGLGYVVFAQVMSYFGDGAMGGFSNASRIEQIILLPVIGLQIAVLAIIGQNMGAQRYDRVRQTFALGIKIALGIMACGMVAVWLTHDLLSQVFAAGNSEVRRMSNFYLLYSSFGLAAYALVLICGGVLQGMKRPLVPLLVNIVRLIVGPAVVFWGAITLFDVPNIHLGWLGSMLIAWGAGIFSLLYVRRQIATLEE